jgi:hypothetical protein
MTSPHFPRRTHVESAEFVISSIEALGITVNPTSRLAQMKKVLSRPGDNIIPQNDPDFETALEGLREFTLLAFIFDNLKAHPEDSELRRKVKAAMKDSVLPQSDKSLSRGRDAQFELFVFAICLSANLTPVAFEEPDVTCVIESTKYGIAAKRVKSKNTLEDRIKDASRQIERVGLPGIIALDTCLALNPQNERFWKPMSNMTFGRLYSARMQRFMQKHDDRIQELVRGKGVRGIIIHDHLPRLIADNEWTTESMTVRHNTARENSRRNKEFELFSRSYPKGLPNLEHL